MKAGVATHVGRVRDINEDNYCMIDGELHFFMVADGMGGYNGGEVASMLAIDTIKEHLIDHLTKDIQNLDQHVVEVTLQEAFQRANQVILERSSNDVAYEGMGTTATLAFHHESRLYVGHVGDSRAYLIHEGKIRQISQDHSLVAELVRRGSISEREAMRHPQKNIITRALGTDLHTQVDTFSVDFLPEDCLVLCTDGLSNYVDALEIENMVQEITDPQQCCQELVALANQRGGFDNITVVLVKNSTDHTESR